MRHLRDMPSPATGTQGYQIQTPLPVGACDFIAQLPHVKTKPLRGGWVCTRWNGAGSGNLGISAMCKPKGFVTAWHLDKGRGRSESKPVCQLL